MMKRTNKFYAGICLILLNIMFLVNSCEKELDMDFTAIAPRTVIDGAITPGSIGVRLSKTTDVLAKDSFPLFTDATMELIAEKGTMQRVIPLSPDAEGVYRPTTPITAEIGTVYQLRTQIDSEYYQASTQLHALGSVSQPYFEWSEVNSSLQMLFLRFTLEDVKEEENYYYVRVLRRDRLFGEQFIKDRGKDGDTIKVDLFCTTNTMMEEADAEEHKNEASYIFDNDTLVVQLRSVDKKTFDYLESVHTVRSNGGDPFKMFIKERDGAKADDLLGYFAAYTEKVDTLVYHEP